MQKPLVGRENLTEAARRRLEILSNRGPLRAEKKAIERAIKSRRMTK